MNGTQLFHLSVGVLLSGWVSLFLGYPPVALVLFLLSMFLNIHSYRKT